MERLAKGPDISDFVDFGGSTSFCDFFGIVKKGHEVCGDSVFVYTDDSKTILGVFDGVSGESGADLASAEAASGFLDYLKKINKIDKAKMEEAAHFAKRFVKSGFTTASILFLEKDSTFLVASVGDSPIYSVNKNGEIDLELPLSRSVGDGDSILKFFNFRVFVSTVFGGFDSELNQEIHMNMRKGKLAKGEILIIASDCLIDNLTMEIKEGFISDSTGKADLKSLINGKTEPEKIVKKLFSEIQKRINGQKIESQTQMLIPKQDDLAIIVLRRL